jgi:NAD(P)-dependent dehydrogenase (short-subunit alcohol dehydrogenase family)
MPTLPEFNLDGKVAIVTGAAQGIGKGIAKSLARAGADIVIAGISLGDRENDDKAMQSAAAEIAEMGTKVLPITADLRNLDEVENLMSQTLDQFGGKLDIMVNNAGGSFNGHFMEISDRGYEAVTRNNFRTTFLGCQSAAKIMLEEGGGTIINLASTTAFNPATTQPVYGANKAAIMHLTQTLAVEFAPTIRVNAVAPGLTDTEGLRAQYPDNPDEVISTLSEDFAAKRLATTNDIGLAVVFLCSDAASHISGVTMKIDGGGMAMR